MYSLTGGVSFSFNPAYATDGRTVNPKDDFDLPDYDGKAIGDLPEVPHMSGGGSSSLPGLVNNTSPTVHGEEKGKLTASTPNSANEPRNLFPHIRINAQSLIPQSNVVALISNRPCSNELEAFVELLQKNFPEKCCKVHERVRDGEHLKNYFDSQDILLWGSLFLSAVIEDMISINKAKSANGTYLKEAHVFTRRRMRKHLKRFYGLPQPPTARGYRFGQDKIERFGEIWLDQALRCIWLEAKIYYETIRWMRDNDEDFTGVRKRPKASDIFTEEQLRDFSDVDLDEAYKVVWLYQNRHYSKELPLYYLSNGFSNTGPNGVSGSNGSNGSNGNNGNNGDNGSNVTSGSNSTYGTNGFSGTNGMDLEDPIPPAPLGLRNRGNFKSDPEQQIQRQLHEVSSEQFTTVVKKQCVEIALKGNPSSQLQIWDLVPVQNRATPSNLTAQVYSTASSQNTSNSTQQQPLPHCPPLFDFAVGVRRCARTVAARHPSVINDVQTAETTASTPFESVGEASSSDQIKYNSSALGEDVSRDDSPSRVGTTSTPQPPHLWESELGSTPPTLTRPAVVGTQPSQQPVNPTPVITPVVPDRLLLERQARRNRWDAYLDDQQRRREADLVCAKEAALVATKAEHAALEASHVDDTQHHNTNAQSDHEAKGSKLLKAEPEPDVGEVSDPERKSDVEGVEETKATKPIRSETESGSSGVTKVTGNLSSDALFTSDPNKIAQSEPEGEATQSTEEANRSRAGVYQESDDRLTENSAPHHQSSPAMKDISETAKGKLTESHLETGNGDVGGPRNDSVAEDAPDEKATTLTTADEAKRAKRKEKDKRQRERRRARKIEETEREEASKGVQAAMANSTANFNAAMALVNLANGEAVVSDTPNQTEPVPVQNQTESSRAHTTEISASTVFEDQSPKQKRQSILQELTEQAISLDEVKRLLNEAEVAQNRILHKLRQEDPEYRERQGERGQQEAAEHAGRVEEIEGELNVIRENKRGVKEEAEQLRARIASLVVETAENLQLE